MKYLEYAAYALTVFIVAIIISHTSYQDGYERGWRVGFKKAACMALDLDSYCK